MASTSPSRNPIKAMAFRTNCIDRQQTLSVVAIIRSRSSTVMGAGSFRSRWFFGGRIFLSSPRAGLLPSRPLSIPSSNTLETTACTLSTVAGDRLLANSRRLDLIWSRLTWSMGCL